MIKIEGIEYRNLQEQVAKNANDISELGDDYGSFKTSASAKLSSLSQDIAGLGSTKQDRLTAGEGIDITGNVISSTASGGSQLYLHSIHIVTNAEGNVDLKLVTTFSTPIESTSSLTSLFLPANIHKFISGYITNATSSWDSNLIYAQILAVSPMYGELSFKAIQSIATPDSVSIGGLAFKSASISSGISLMADSVTPI